MKKIFITGFITGFISIPQTLLITAQTKKEIVVVENDSKHLEYETIKDLPRQAVSIGSGSNYAYFNGVFYKPISKGYIIVSPPFGIRVSNLPKNSFRISTGERIYFYNNGIFYTQDLDGPFKVVPTTMGVLIDALPLGCTHIIKEKIHYYKLKEVYYKQILTTEMNTMYQVGGKP